MMKRTLAATAGALALTGGTAFMATPAQAAPVVTGGLVNVTVTDVIDGGVVNVENNNVGVAAVVGIAANVCDVNVGGILGELRKTGTATCESAVDQRNFTFTQAQ